MLKSKTILVPIAFSFFRVNIYSLLVDDIDVVVVVVRITIVVIFVITYLLIFFTNESQICNELKNKAFFIVYLFDFSINKKKTNKYKINGSTATL